MPLQLQIITACIRTYTNRIYYVPQAASVLTTYVCPSCVCERLTGPIINQFVRLIVRDLTSPRLLHAWKNGHQSWIVFSLFVSNILDRKDTTAIMIRILDWPLLPPSYIDYFLFRPTRTDVPLEGEDLYIFFF